MVSQSVGDHLKNTSKQYFLRRKSPKHLDKIMFNNILKSLNNIYKSYIELYLFAPLQLKG